MSFKIDVIRNPEAGPDDPHRISIRSGTHVFTRLLRMGEKGADEFLEAPPAQLAFWMIDNWWRLRWECVPPSGMTPDWRLAHDLSSIGGGSVWPRLSMWGEGGRMGLSSRSDPQGVMGPVRYLDDTLTFVPAEDWERSVDVFIDSAADSAVGFGSDREALKANLDALANERAESEAAAWRRLEARLGFDPDDAPEALMRSLGEAIERYDAAGVEEAVQAAPGSGSAETLRQEIEAARASRLVCNFDDAVRAAGQIEWCSERAPWVPAEAAARRIRQQFHVDPGRLGNLRLSQVLGVSRNALASTDAAPAAALPYGLRIIDGRQNGGNVVALRSRRSHDRRFDLARALGDAIWSEGSQLGPIARTRTDRQRFQRAFAQSLLCPFEDLEAFIGNAEITDEEIMATAQHFHVNSRVIETTLVKKGVLPPGRFEDMIEAA